MEDAKRGGKKTNKHQSFKFDISGFDRKPKDFWRKFHIRSRGFELSWLQAFKPRKPDGGDGIMLRGRFGVTDASALHTVDEILIMSEKTSKFFYFSLKSTARWLV